MATNQYVERNKKLATDFFTKVFNEGDLSIVSKMIGPNYTYNGQPTSPEGTQKWAEALRAQVPDLHFTIDDILGEGDQVALRWTLTGHDAEHNVAVTASATNILAFDASGLSVSNWQSGGEGLSPAKAS